MAKASSKPWALPKAWAKQLDTELQQPYMQELRAFLDSEAAAGKVVYPSQADLFNAFTSADFKKVKVVILGQDPYHGAGQAHGLSFSVPQGIKIPPSLLNIFKELNRDLNLSIPNHGCLQSWAKQGVLLLNDTLSVEQSLPGSHQKQGWEQFTDKVISSLNEQREGLVFMLWGKSAHSKGAIIDKEKHCVLTSVHPSPLSAYRGFLGCGHFSECNKYLLSQGQEAIDWQLVDAPPSVNTTLSLF